MTPIQSVRQAQDSGEHLDASAVLRAETGVVRVRRIWPAAAMVVDDICQYLDLRGGEAVHPAMANEICAVFIVVFSRNMMANIVEQRGELQGSSVVNPQTVNLTGRIEESKREASDLMTMALVGAVSLQQIQDRPSTRVRYSLAKRHLWSMFQDPVDYQPVK